MLKELSKDAEESKRLTMAWIVFVMLYWTGFTIIPAIVVVDLGRYPFWTWIFGMIGAMSCYYALKAGYSADSLRGKPIVAFTTLAISCDWSASAYDGIKGYLYWYGGVRMFFHAAALLWATVFFYRTAISESKGKLFVWSSLVLEWVDLIFMSVVIVLLDNIEDDGCFNNSTCLGYFSVLTIFMVVWFLPIMFGQSATSKAMHIHLIVLDSVTHLPLVLTVIISDGFRIHWFVFVDVAYKLILLLRVYGYHGFYELIVNREEIEKQYKEEMKEIDKDNEPDDDDDDPNKTDAEKPTPGNFAE